MAVIEGHGFRQLNYSAFRRCVGRAVASGHKPEYRCHIDDRTAPSFSHVRQRATRQQPDGTNVHIKSLIPLLLSNLLRGPDMESTRIVQQKVQSAELFQRTVNETSNFASFGNVGGNRKRRLADLVCNFLNAILSPAYEPDSRPFSRHGYRACTSNPTARTGDDPNLAFQSLAHDNHYS